MNKFIADEADVIVGMGEWGEAAGSQTIATTSLGTCIGVAVFSPDLRAGYVAHSEGPQLEPIMDMLSRVADQHSDRSRLLAWVGGGEELPPELGLETYGKPRQEVVNFLINLGVAQSNIQISWLEDNGETADMVLDCSSGQCETIVFSLEELLLDRGDYLY